MSKKKALLGTALAGAATALAVLGAAGTAQAGDIVVYSTDSGGGVHGAMWHIDDGDTFRVVDLMADGHGVRGRLFDWQGNQIRKIYNGQGNQKAVEFPFDVVSNYEYTMEVCNVDGPDDTTGADCKSRDFM